MGGRRDVCPTTGKGRNSLDGQHTLEERDGPLCQDAEIRGACDDQQVFGVAGE